MGACRGGQGQEGRGDPGAANERGKHQDDVSGHQPENPQANQLDPPEAPS
ncbi:hypothetical protein StoSoilB19_18560 [Arthrobacter sp. StoSoilB19]|nr:hypothetical protein StoSoilB19_18560 [Arthrobacter sp. StoSoilB19]